MTRCSCALRQRRCLLLEIMLCSRGKVQCVQELLSCIRMDSSMEYYFAYCGRSLLLLPVGVISSLFLRPLVICQLSLDRCMIFWRSRVLDSVEKTWISISAWLKSTDSTRLLEDNMLALLLVGFTFPPPKEGAWSGLSRNFRTRPFSYPKVL